MAPPDEQAIASAQQCGELEPSASAKASAAVPLDQLHVNLWEVVDHPKQSDRSSLDLGIKLNDWSSVSAVLVDLPWQVVQDDVSDLGTRLNSEKTIAAVFNEIVQYDGCADLSYARVSFRRSDVVDLTGKSANNYGHFCLLRLAGKAYKLSTVSLGHGITSTQLQVDLPPLDELEQMGKGPIYLRFRIDNVPRSVYSYIFRQADRNLLSSSLETRIIDFRINVRRGIPDEIFASDKSLIFPKFGKIHFFLTIDREQICGFESKNFVGCRSLIEEAVWNEYLNGPNSGAPADGMKKFLGYQWTESIKDSTDKEVSKGVKDLVVLGRFSSYKSSTLATFRFVLLVLIFGMMGSGLWDFFKADSQDAQTGYWTRKLGQLPDVIFPLGIPFLIAVVLITLWDRIRAFNWRFWRWRP